MTKQGYAVASRSAAEEFLKANEDLLEEANAEYGVPEATKDYQDLRFIGLNFINGTSFVPTTGGAKAGFYGPLYGHYVDTELTEGKVEAPIGDHLLRKKGGAGSQDSAGHLPFPIQMQQTGNEMEFQLHKDVVKELPNGTKKWTCFVSKASVMSGQGSSPVLSSTLFGQGASIVTNKGKGVSARGSFNLNHEDALATMFTASGLQSNPRICLPGEGELQPHLGAAKPLCTSALYILLFGAHNKTISKTHDALGHFNQRASQVRGADAYAQIIWFYSEFGTLEAKQLGDYYVGRLVKSYSASAPAWKKYVDYAAGMKLYITGHDAESMKELGAYKRLHGYFLRQLRDAFAAETAEVVEATPGVTALVKAAAASVLKSGENQEEGGVVSCAVGLSPEAVADLIQGVVVACYRDLDTTFVTALAQLTARVTQFGVGWRRWRTRPKSKLRPI
jgi:ribose 5-phosphate isomerase RpiB